MKKITKLDDYQKAAMRTAPRDPNAYSVPPGVIFQYNQEKVEKLFKNLDQMIWSLGLTGEAGEFADMMKKAHGHGHELDNELAAKELGDVLWYLSVLADSLGYTLSDIATMNVEKLKKRYKKGFTIAESKNKKG